MRWRIRRIVNGCAAQQLVARRDVIAPEFKKHTVELYAYVLMTNHVHLLMTPKEGEGPSNVMKDLGQRYLQYINRTYRRSGTLWEGRFRSCLVGGLDASQRSE